MRRRLVNLGAVIAVVAATLAVAPSLPSSAEVPPDQRPGQLDKSFNPCQPSQPAPCDGKVTMRVPGSGYSRGHAVAVQKDGKAVVVGQAWSTAENISFAVVRYNVDGDLDDSFGDGGTVITPIPVAQPGPSPALDGVDPNRPGSRYSFSVAYAVAIQDDGKIVVGGCAACEPGDDYHAGYFALARYNPDGSLDPGFGRAGRVTTSFRRAETLFAPTGRAVVHALAIQRDGKIVAAGSVQSPGRQFALARYLPDGSLDRNFGIDGTQTTSFRRPDSEIIFADAYAVAIQDDDRIVVAGHARHEHALARYTSEGNLDCLTPLAGCNAQVTAPWLGGGVARSVVLQRDGRIVLGGGGAQGFTLIRFNADLALDESFGSGGVATTNFVEGTQQPAARDHSLARAAVLQPQLDGTSRIVVFGHHATFSHWRAPNNPVYRYRFAVAGFNLDGQLDSGFGSAGKVLTSFAPASASAEAMALDPAAADTEGFKIVGAGWENRSWAKASNTPKIAVARYEANGSADESFDEDGRAITSVPVEGSDALSAIAEQPDGKVVGVGTSGDRIALARYRKDGRADETFNPCRPGERPGSSACGGKLVVPLPPVCTDATEDCMATASASDVGVLPDGRIVVSGSSGRSGGPYSAVFARFHEDGSRDATFGEDGQAVLSFGCESAHAGKMQLEDDGTITALIQRTCGDNNTVLRNVIRLDPIGHLDGSFGPTGDGLSEVPDLPARSSLAALARQDDGRVVVGVLTDLWQAQNAKFIVVGFRDGIVDKEFGPDGTGRVVTTFSGPTFLFDLAIHPRGSRKAGSIVAVGRAGNPREHAPHRFALAQYTNDGKPDTAFNSCLGGTGPVSDCDGKALTSFGPPQYSEVAQARAVVVDREGRIVVAGFVGTGAPGTPGLDEYLFALARYTPEGQLDTACYGFGEAGKMGTAFHDASGASAWDVLIEEDGQIVAGGDARTPNRQDALGLSQSYEFALARYHGGSPKCGLSVADPPIVAEPVSGATPVTFTVTREGDPTLPATVDYTTVEDIEDNSAVAGRDYTQVSGRLSFGIGESSKTITVDVLADPEVEVPEHFLLRLSNPVGAEIVDDTAKAVITNTSPSIAIGDTRVPEPTSGTVPAAFTLTMSNPVPYPVRVTYATANGTATAGSDYNAVSRAVTIPAGDTDALVTIDVIGDTDAEGEEDFFVDVGAAQGAVVGKSRGRGVIFEPGPGISVGDTSVTEGNSGITRAAFTVVANRESTKAVTVAYASADASATAGEDYRRATGTVRLAPGEMGKTVVVEVIAETAPEADETYSLNLGAPLGAALARSSGTGTIVNDDEAGTPTPPPPGGPPPTAVTGLPGSPAPPSLVAPQVPGQVQAPSQAQAGSQATSQATSQAASQATAPSVANSPAAAAQVNAQVAAQAQLQPQAAMMVERERQAQVETVGMRGGGLSAASLMASARQRTQPGPAPVLALVWAGAAMGIGLGVADRRRHRSGAFAGVHPVQAGSVRRRPGGWRRRAGGPGARSR